MSKIKNAFKNGKALIPFITGGDPSLEVTEELICAMEKAGADLIEIGIPFSDPVAESVTVQEANERALAAGCTADKLFDMAAKVQGKIHVPLVFMAYANLIYTYGKEKFIKRCRESGVDGLVVPDLPFEEKGEIFPECEQYGIDLISLMVPSSCERIAMIAGEARGFLCGISPMGVAETEKGRKRNGIEEMLKLARENSGLPCVMDPGSGTLEQVKAMAALCDGIVAGEAILKLVAQHGKDSAVPVAEYIRAMKEAIA